MRKIDGHVFLNTETHISKEKIFHPPADSSPVYAWCWNAMPTREQTDKDLEEFQRLGIKALYILPEPQSFRPAGIPTTFSVEYLGREYMNAYTYAINRAIEKGFGVWLYDECGWPSGGAGGKVLLSHPEYAKRFLAVRTETYFKGDVYGAKPGDTAFAPDGNRIEDGYVFSGNTELTIYYSKRDFFTRPGVPDFPDILLKDATEEFIRITHETYKKHLGTHFGSAIKAMFTDEPTAPRPVPYRKELEEEFQRRTGYAIHPYLPELSGNRRPQGKAAEAVIAWFDMCSELFCSNFMLPCKKWCNENGISFLGHLDIDHKPDGSVQGGNFNIMRAMRCFDVPGIDVIWRQIFPCEKGYHFDNIWGENRFFPRYAGSAASQIGSSHAMTESFGVFGNGLTFSQMRYVFNFQAIRGVNVLNPMLAPYGDDKGFQMVGEPPFLKEKFACYADLKTFNEYIERLMYITGIGRNIAETALYLPIRDFYVNAQDSEYCKEYEKAGFQMEDAQIPFDIFDDDVILCSDKALLPKGIIAMGNARYTTVVVTSCRYMRDDVKDLLGEFIAGGGSVIAIKGFDTFALQGAEVVENVTDALSSPLSFLGTTKGIRLMHRKAENADIYCISNENYHAAQVSLEADKNACLVNITSGSVAKVPAADGMIRFTLESGEMYALVYSDSILAEEEGSVYSQEIILDGEYTVRRTKQFIIDELESYNKPIEEAPRPAVLGDWRDFAGKNYSGSCIYKTKFKAQPDMADALLDLGDVRYTAEVFLNGKSLGVRVMPPYTYVIKAANIAEDNELEIRVTNTAANEYFYTKSFDKWPAWMLTPYYEKTQLFHGDSLYGGLYGPVRVCY